MFNTELFKFTSYKEIGIVTIFPSEIEDCKSKLLILGKLEIKEAGKDTRNRT